MILCQAETATAFTTDRPVRGVRPDLLRELLYDERHEPSTGCGVSVDPTRAKMVINAQTQGKPAYATRTLAATLALLAMTCGLAWSLTSQSGSDGLNPPVVVRDWSLSFQPPRGFESVKSGRTLIGPTLMMQGLTASRLPATIAVYQLEGFDRGEERHVCERVLRMHMSGRSLSETEHQTRFDQTIGDRNAVEIRVTGLGAVVRSVVLRSGIAYAVWLGVDSAYIPEDIAGDFDRMCRSFRFDDQ